MPRDGRVALWTWTGWRETPFVLDRAPAYEGYTADSGCQGGLLGDLRCRGTADPQTHREPIRREVARAAVAARDLRRGRHVARGRA